MRASDELVAAVREALRQRGAQDAWQIADRIGSRPPEVFRAIERLRQADQLRYQWAGTGSRSPRRLWWLDDDAK
jgi:hypothetical protein